uniref:chitinase CLP-like n=1 Tax=Erigeron canadensis TaxID=72917 RepID=UPI001CB8BB98|nr:chitinase CLP-like [Erigeron canadensis]
MFWVVKLLVLVLALIISYENDHRVIALPPYTSIVVPVTKRTDAAKPLYSVEIMTASVNMRMMTVNFLIDIDAPFIWNDCIIISRAGSCPTNTVCAYPINCQGFLCSNVRTTYSYKIDPPSCPPLTNSSTLPGSGFCICPVNAVNPVTGSCAQPILNEEGFTANISNGRNVFSIAFNGVRLNAACATSSTFQSFPATVTGVLAISTSAYAIPNYLYDPLKRSFALCLPSTASSSTPGVLFFGGGPYYLLPQSDVDVRSYLSYTPLLNHPGSFGYFIRVDSIVIRFSSIAIPTNLATKLSTIDPYTALRTDIYNSLVRIISFYTIGVPRASPVAPFGLCFRTFLPLLLTAVPDIDLILPDGVKWTIYTSNSIIQVSRDVACLAFVDGGATLEHAIVIRTYQLEDNFLEFSLENSTLGFSSSLLRRRTSCTNFNFTLTNSG